MRTIGRKEVDELSADGLAAPAAETYMVTVDDDGEFGSQEIPDGVAVPETFDDLIDGTTNKAFTATEKTKLAGMESAADVTDAANVSSSGGMIVVNHGATSGTTRPSVSGAVTWIGTVEPTNASNGDVWLDI